MYCSEAKDRFILQETRKPVFKLHSKVNLTLQGDTTGETIYLNTVTDLKKKKDCFKKINIHSIAAEVSHF